MNPSPRTAVDRPNQAGGAVIYHLVPEMSEIPDDLRLRNIEWGVLLAITGQHSATQIGDAFDLDEAERRRVFARLLETGLIEEQPVTWSEYLRANAITPSLDGEDRRQDLRTFLRAGVTLPAPAAAAASPDPSRQHALTRPVPTPFTPLATPRSEARTRRLSLKVLMRHILDRAPDANSGQLDVYRVFIRVDTQLLKRSGIDTLRFEDDRVVEDPELQQAIARSLERTLGMALPADTYI